jgi:hypothetical protein
MVVQFGAGFRVAVTDNAFGVVVVNVIDVDSCRPLMDEDSSVVNAMMSHPPGRLFSVCADWNFPDLGFR